HWASQDGMEEMAVSNLSIDSLQGRGNSMGGEQIRPEQRRRLYIATIPELR
ncbi:unnamed protein product, partial [Adineta steineri]